MTTGFGFVDTPPPPPTSLGQAIDPAQLANVELTLQKSPDLYQSAGRGGMVNYGGQISTDYDQYIQSTPFTGGRVAPATVYEIPTGASLQGIPLVAVYDANGNFQHITLPADQAIQNISPNDPTLVAQPKLNAQGQIIDYGIGSTKDIGHGGFFGGFLDSIQDLGPLILTAIGANLFTGANLLGDAAGAASGAAGGAANVGTTLADLGAPTAASYGGILGGGSTALTGGIAPEIIGGITASDIGSLAGGAPTAASYGGVLGGGSTALTGGSLTDLASAAGTGGTSLTDLSGASSGTGLKASTGSGLNLVNETGGGLGINATTGNGLDLAASTGGGLGLTAGSAGAGVIGGNLGNDLAAINTGVNTGLTTGINKGINTGVTTGGSGGVTTGGGGTTDGSITDVLKKITDSGGSITDALSKIFGGVGGATLLSSLAGLLSNVNAGNTAKDAAQIQANAALKAAQMQQDMFNTVNAQGAPYRGAGYNALNLIGSMLPGQYTQYDASGKPIGTATGTGYLTQQYSPEQFQKDIDPGYAFRLQQGQMANQRASNLAGGLIGGNALQGLQDYTQGMASQEYGNAFNRFQTQRGNIYNTLAGIAGIGQTAQGQANTLAQNNATAQGQLGVGAAAAQAAGKMGQAAGYGGALTNAANNYLLSQILNQNQGAAASSGSRFMDTTG